MREQVADRHGQVMIGVHESRRRGHDAVTIRIGIVAESDAILLLEPDQARHRVGARAIHADLAVVIDRHEAKRRIDAGIHHGNVEVVDRL